MDRCSPRPITDRWGRQLRYLRVSVTDRCNLRCRYCMPPQGIPLLRHEEILTYEQIAAAVRAAVGIGISSVRITGGEPLVRRELVKLVAMLREIQGLHDLSMTTNGTLLAEAAPSLAQAGLQRVNISIDSLDAAEYADITSGGDLDAALASVRAALAARMEPVKVNAVMCEDRDDHALRRWMEPFIALARSMPVHVRFIEHMPVGGLAPHQPQGRRVAQIVESLGTRPASDAIPGAGPARYWRLEGAPGSLGLIAPMSEPFCDHCNRLRLTARGELRQCVFSPPGVSLRPLLISPMDEGAVAAALAHAWLSRPAGRGSLAADSRSPTSMCQVGG